MLKLLTALAIIGVSLWLFWPRRWTPPSHVRCEVCKQSVAWEDVGIEKTICPGEDPYNVYQCYECVRQHGMKL